MDFTKPKSIFDIPKTILVEPPTARRVVKRRKRKKVKKVKVAKAGGVEVSQKRNVRGQKQIVLKHKGGLTQEITIHTGDQKPRGAKAKGQTANWNMKPAKFKASRGLRDDRVYIQPPKREYFGNRYKSAIEEQKINQKVKEAGASKNKEIASVRETANIQKRELERREAAKEKTITELQRSAAGLVASHNVSVRNQSQATILGGDVGELNKLIDRRGVGSIRQLILKGEISDASTIYQLNLPPDAIDRLIRTLDGEKQTLIVGSRLVYITPDGNSRSGVLERESGKFVFLRLESGEAKKIPKGLIQRGADVAEARTRSRSESVRRGGDIPAAEDFGEVEERAELRRTASDRAERPAWRKSARRNDLGGASPRDTSAEPPRFSAEPKFEEEIVRLSKSAGVRAAPAVSEDEFTVARVELKKGISKKFSAPPVSVAEETGGETGGETAYEDAIAAADALLAEPEPAPEPAPEEPEPAPAPEPEFEVEDVKPKATKKKLGRKIPKKTEATPESEELSGDEDSDFTAGNVVFMNAAQVKDRARKDKGSIILVDNRPESKLKDGGRPAIKISVKSLNATIASQYGADSKKSKAAKKKIASKEYKDFYSNDDKLLDEFFG